MKINHEQMHTTNYTKSFLKKKKKKITPKNSFRSKITQQRFVSKVFWVHEGP